MDPPAKNSPKLGGSNGVSKTAGDVPNKPAPVPSTSKAKAQAKAEDDDDIPLGQLLKSPHAAPAKPAASSTTAKPATAAPASKSATPSSKPATPATPSSKPAASSTAKTPAMKVEKTTDTKDEKTTTPTAVKNTTTTVTTTKTTTPSSTKTTTVTDTLTTSTPKKVVKKEKAEDSDDDKPLSSLAHEKKTVVVKTEKKDNAVVTKEKTTVVKRDIKEEKKDDKKASAKKAPAKPTPKKKRKVESDSDESESSEEEKTPKKRAKKKAVESDSEDESESESDSDDEPKKKGAKKKKGDDDEKPKKKGKKEGEEDEWKWWLEPPLPDGKKWTSLVHNGVMFAEPYVPHKVKFYYDGKPIDLSSAAEEVATFYAKYLETDYPTKENFNTNFWTEFKAYLTSDQKKVIKDFAKADFTHIHKYLVAQKELKAQKTPEQKKAEKEEKEKLVQKYGYAMVSGHRQRISNWAIERPGLFLGRGKHPKTGLVKKRIEAEDITINIGKGVPVPEPPPGHKWGKVVHDDKVAWLAMWKENINNGFKYVWLHASSAIKGQSDMKKFEVARNLKGQIDKIRKKYTKELESDDLEVRQRSTALYLIDKLALRVGNEKDEETADTVGCCSLRVEHITLKEPQSVTLDFLGKDSMRYLNTVDVDKLVFKNLQEFMHKPGNKKSPKKPDTDLFDQLTTSSLNKYLKEFMPNLSAKVFRTFNASLTLEKELAKMPAQLMHATNDEKVLFYNRCNREVAILCNHQRSQSKTHGETMGKIDDKIADFEKKKQKLHQQIQYLKGKGKKPELSDSESDEESSTPKKATPNKAEKKDEKKSTKKEKDEEDDFATPTKKRKKGEEAEDDFADTPKKKVKRALPDDIDKCKAAIERVEASIKKWNVKKTEKDELKTVALTTSKINYIDPRITAAWAKKVGLPMDKLFSKSLREKFPWAMDVDTDWKF